MSLIMPHIRKLEPYPLGVHPPEEEKAVKLNQNENPYSVSPKVLQALTEMNEEELRRYPDASCTKLRAALAAYHGVKASQVFCGNGSSEIISLLFRTLIGSQGRIALPDPTFHLYSKAAAVHQTECVHIPTREDFSVNIDALLQSGATAIIIVNPNAPTGLLLPLAEIERVLQRFGGLVVIDEAYIDYAEEGASAVPLLERYPQLLVLRTFSKSYGLCGARVGYGLAGEELTEALEKSKDIYNVNAISQRLALAALNDREHVERTIQAVKRTRETFSAKLRELGYSVLPSQANFVLCTPPSGMGAEAALLLYERLAERGFYVRYFAQERLADKLRISIGTEEEMEQLYAELCQLVS